MNTKIEHDDLILKDTNGKKISCWSEWTRPKRDYQWTPGRSAMELAKAWFRDGHLSPPKELFDLLSSHKRFQGLELIKGIPEKITNLPVKGEGRNHDLWLLGKTSDESVTICIEAKADEPFGSDTIEVYLQKARNRIKEEKPTGVPKRIKALLKIVGGNLSKWGIIQYQLLTALSGTILQAKQDCSTLAVFIVHIFETNLTTPEKLEKNAYDYSRFLEVLGFNPDHCSDGNMYGPVTIDGVECLIGKIVARVP
ncbi:MAG: hypothetical protein KAR42_11460 [candidate division Zixibacteria bacterium]|nr:hypothetical protein [candidate division Zixibacteria bacterium]